MKAVDRTLAYGVGLALLLGITPRAARANTPAERSPACSRFVADKFGEHRIPITTVSGEAQRLFDEGFALSYAFNHDEAARSFRLALREDPRCAMCFWGLAYVLGPNINHPMPEANEPTAYEAVQKAVALRDGVSARERAYVEALATRYAPTPVADRSRLDRAFAEAMKGVAARFPRDLDAQAVYAEALMDTSPWNYWGPGGTATDFTRQLVTTLEGVLATAPRHVGANHFYIHAVESARPEWGLGAADRLGDLAPGAGHLVHMPSHIYIGLGRYHEGSVANEKAIQADRSYLERCGSFGFYPTLYVPHNYAFLVSTSSFEGRSELALETARSLAALARGGHEHARREPSPHDASPHEPSPHDAGGGNAPMSADAQQFLSTPWLTMVRFGKWSDVLAAAEPATSHVYARALFAYARGIALVRSGRVEEATRTVARLEALAGDGALDGQLVMGLNPARDILHVGLAEARGELAAAVGNYDEAIRNLEEGVAREDALRYIEPPPWYHSVRLSLGAILLQAGELKEAERVFREDLARFTKNGWALFGLRESLALQGRTKESSLVRAEFERAWSRADVTLRAPRF